MTESSASESEILAYVYDELSSAERREFEQKMDGEPALRAEVEGLLATRQWLGADARFGEESGRDTPPPQLVDAIVQAEAIARSAEVREALQAQPAGSAHETGWLGRLNQWVFGGGIAVAATLAFLVFRDAPEHDEPPAMDSVMQAAKYGNAKAPDGSTKKTIASKAAKSTGLVPAAAPSARSNLSEKPVAEVASEPVSGDEKGAGTTGPADKRVRRTKAKATVAQKSSDSSEGQMRERAAKEAAPKSESEAAAEAPFESNLGGMGSGGVGEAEESRAAFLSEPSAAESAALDVSAPARGARAMPPVPRPAARAKAAQKRMRMKAISSDRQERMQLREDLRKQEAQSAAQMSLASAGIALNEKRYQEALELFVRAGHEDRSTKSLGAAPWIGQMRALLALERLEQALALFPALKNRTRGQSEERALAHWYAGQAAERLARFAEAKSHYRFAARSHASLQAQARAAFQRVQQAQNAAKKSAGAAVAAEQPPTAVPATP